MQTIYWLLFFTVILGLLCYAFPQQANTYATATGHAIAAGAKTSVNTFKENLQQLTYVNINGSFVLSNETNLTNH